MYNKSEQARIYAYQDFIDVVHYKVSHTSVFITLDHCYDIIYCTDTSSHNTNTACPLCICDRSS